MGVVKRGQTGKGDYWDDVSSVAFLPDGEVTWSASNDRVFMLLYAAMGAGARRIGVHIEKQIHHR